MKYTVALALLSIMLFSCFPKDMKEQMTKAMQQSQIMVRDMQFRAALDNIELYKLRNGHYPESLNDLTYMTQMDSSYALGTEYTLLENGYELNVKGLPKESKPYPDDFWKGLGCVKSNLMREGFVNTLPQADSSAPDSSAVIQ